MVEMLIRVEDKRNLDDPEMDAKLTKRGDVIVVMPDGWNWGRAELSAPFWRIVRVPLTMDEANAMLGEQKDTDPLNPSRVLRRRAFKYDLDAIMAALPRGARDAFDDVERKTPIIDAATGPFRASKIEHSRLPEPGVIG